MSSASAKGPLAFPLIGDLVNRVPGGPKYARVGALALGVVLVALTAFGIARSRRYAAWAPIDVVESRDPLQELPVRVTGSQGAVAPAHTYDAVIDMASISSIVVGVDLDFLPKGAARYEVAVQAEDGAERFRDTIPPHYFDEGRFMLRLFARRFRPGDYLLEILAFDAEGGSRVVGASWFQLTK
jgi:hypothetical protein